MGAEVLLPGSDAYEAARRPAMARFADTRPAAVVRCATPEDVAEALAYARLAARWPFAAAGTASPGAPPPTAW